MDLVPAAFILICNVAIADLSSVYVFLFFKIALPLIVYPFNSLINQMMIALPTDVSYADASTSFCKCCPVSPWCSPMFAGVHQSSPVIPCRWLASLSTTLLARVPQCFPVCRRRDFCVPQFSPSVRHCSPVGGLLPSGPLCSPVFRSGLPPSGTLWSPVFPVFSGGPSALLHAAGSSYCLSWQGLPPTYMVGVLASFCPVMSELTFPLVLLGSGCLAGFLMAINH